MSAIDNTQRLNLKLFLETDISENELVKLDGIIPILLRDNTTGSNIIWATKDYESRGTGYKFTDEITPERITGDNVDIIQPRVRKDIDAQKQRSRDKAEVFTPAWVCNKQNNLIDDAWFGRSEVFNVENADNAWTSHPIPLFPENRRLVDYIKDRRLEVTCGEAPYLVSRYDATTGQNIPIGQRIGLLDRKLWAINKLTPNIEDDTPHKKAKNIKRQWRRMVLRAYQSIYGFEWQGDNLLLAREALFVSFIEYFQSKWHTEKLPPKPVLEKVAEIISWNLWQMDGLTCGIPGYTPSEFIDPLDLKLDFPDTPSTELFCRVKAWTDIEPLKGNVFIFRNLLSSKKSK